MNIHVLKWCLCSIVVILRTGPGPLHALKKWGGGWGAGLAQSNFPTRDHQNIFNLILTYIYIYIYIYILIYFLEWGEGLGSPPPPPPPPAPMDATVMWTNPLFSGLVSNLPITRLIFNIQRTRKLSI